MIISESPKLWVEVSITLFESHEYVNSSKVFVQVQNKLAGGYVVSFFDTVA